jgi:hypothetical protein
MPEYYQLYLDSETKAAILNISTQLERLNSNIQNLAASTVMAMNVSNNLAVEISRKNEDSTKAMNKSLGAVEKYLKKWTQST